MRESPELATIESELTYELAANLLAAQDFPSESMLPRLTSVPYNNLGHLPLIDFEVLRKVLWSATWELHERCQRARDDGFFNQIGLTIGAIVLGAGIPLWIDSDAGTSVAMASLAGVVSYFLTAPDLKLVAAKAKAEMISELLQGKVPDALVKHAGDIDRQKKASYGSGIVNRDWITVFFAENRYNLFPGLGWIQVHEVFSCPLKSGEPRPDMAKAWLYETIWGAIDRVQSSLLALHSMGLVVSVDQRTVGRNSRWLDDDLTPHLRIVPPQEFDVDQIFQRDPQASTACFVALQVLVPQQKTLISILVRPFASATSISFELYVCTLGPPSSATIQQRIALTEHLHQHRRISGEPRGLTWAKDLGNFLAASMGMPGNQRTIPDEKESSSLTKRLVNTLQSFDQKVDPLRGKLNRADMEKTRFLSMIVAQEEKAAKELEDLTSFWPGFWTQQGNSRELHSVTMTSDVFRSVECKATIKGLYSSAIRELLAAVESLGCDVNEYRGDRGQLVINSETIGQLVVGESISVVRTETAKKEEKKKTAQVEH